MKLGGGPPNSSAPSWTSAASVLTLTFLLPPPLANSGSINNFRLGPMDNHFSSFLTSLIHRLRACGSRASYSWVCCLPVGKTLFLTSGLQQARAGTGKFLRFLRFLRFGLIIGIIPYVSGSPPAKLWINGKQTRAVVGSGKQLTEGKG